MKVIDREGRRLSPEEEDQFFKSIRKEPEAPKRVWRKIRDDGALWLCAGCGNRFDHDQVIATSTPTQDRQILCEDCVDEDWLDGAVEGPPI